MVHSSGTAADGAALTRSPADGPGGAITGMITRTIKPGCERAFEDLLHSQLAAAGGFPGFLGAEVIRGQGGALGEYTVTFRFQSAEQLRAWEVSSVRAEWLGRMAGLIESQSPLSTMCGLETWFTLAGGGITRPPPRYKMAIVTWLAIFPLATLVNYATHPHVAGMPAAVRALVLTVILIPTMTYLVMPRMTRLFRRWLYPGG